MQNLLEIPTLGSCEPARYQFEKSSCAEMFEALQCLRKDEVFCDIKLGTDDGTMIFGHKVVLASNSPYFHAIFNDFEENDKDVVFIPHLDFATLQLLVDFIYSGEIMVTENNVQLLLPAANLLQLQEIKEVCCDFLQKQLHPTNCFGIKVLADLHGYKKLLTSSELYIQQHFTEVIETDEFLSLTSEQVIKLISSDKLEVPSEENVFECVIRWVKYKLDSRKCILPQLMEHVRLPLTSKNYIITKVIEEPLLNDCHKCKDYIIEALQFHIIKSDQSDLLKCTIPKNIRTKPRLSVDRLHKVIFVVGGFGSKANRSTEWYDPKIGRWQKGPTLISRRYGAGLAVLEDNLVFSVGGVNGRSSLQSVNVLDISSETPWCKSPWNMLVKRKELGVGVINNYLYAVGGHDGTKSFDSTEVFDCNTEEWRMVAYMSTKRANFGVGVMNNLLYAVGGYDLSSKQRLNSVECYYPSLDTWSPVAEMSVCRCGAGVGVLDDVLYAIGGHNGLEIWRSVEAYRQSTGVWTAIADMNVRRQNAGVVAFNGLLYVIGGSDEHDSLDSVEVYNPVTNTWNILEASMNVARTRAGVVAINRPPHFKI